MVPRDYIYSFSSFSTLISGNATFGFYDKTSSHYFPSFYTVLVFGFFFVFFNVTDGILWPSLKLNYGLGGTNYENYLAISSYYYYTIMTSLFYSFTSYISLRLTSLDETLTVLSNLMFSSSFFMP